MESRISKEGLKRSKANARVRTVLGLLLVCAIAFFVITHFGVSLPLVSMVVTGPSKDCVETRGPQILTDTEVRQLEVMDTGIERLKDSDEAIVRVENIDDTAGNVKVTLFCTNGNELGEMTKKIGVGEEQSFVFDAVKDCDLDYIIEPELLKWKVNRTVYVEGQECD